MEQVNSQCDLLLILLYFLQISELLCLKSTYVKLKFHCSLTVNKKQIFKINLRNCFDEVYLIQLN